MSRVVRMLLIGALSAIGLGAMAGPASAGIWTEIPSNTTEEISAIEYQSDARFWFTTKSGSIYTRQPSGAFLQTLPPTGVALNDIEFQSGGQVGLAVGNGGQVFRSINGGASWSASIGAGIPVSKKGTTFVDCTAAQPLGDVYSVRFAGNSRAWIFAEGSQLARSMGTEATVGSPGTWADANWQDDLPAGRDAGDSCKVHPSYGDGYADGFFVPGNPDVGTIVAVSFSSAFLTTNNLGSEAAERTEDAGNGGSTRRKLAGDPANPSRMWATAPEPYAESVTAYTSDGFQNAARWKIVNDGVRTFSPPYDVDFAGGTVLAAGDAGMIVNSVDGANFFYNDASGALATSGWRAVGLASATQGAVGGVGGKLVVSATANVTPDIVKPTGTISGPSTVTAGQAATFTLNAADTGGSGLNAASFTWTSPGIPNGAGSSWAPVFPNRGFATIKVTFADNAGNVAEATKSVSINSAPSGGGASLPVSFSGPGSQLSAKIVGNKVRIRARGTIRPPAGVSIRAACRGKVTLTVKKQRTTLARRKAKLRLENGRCRFGKTIFIKRSRVGANTTRLRLKIAFKGNAALAAGQTTKTLVVRK